MKENNEKKGKGIASMVLGICSIVFCLLGYIPLLAGILAIILSALVLGKHEGGRGMAIAGLITGIIGTACSFIYAMFWTAFASAI